MTTIPWIVDLPPNDVDITGISRASFIRACQGHEKMGDLLSYFILIASHVAKDQRIDTTAPDCTFIDITCKFENIVKKVNISRKSLGNYVKQLESLGYVDAPPYQRVYRVYFKKINAAIKSPPQEVKAKPRGKYAPPTVKPTQEEKDEQKRVVLQTKLVKLQQKLVSLQTKLVTLHKDLVNLPTSQTDKSTPQAAVEGIFDPLRTIQNLLELSREDSLVVSAFAENDAVGISSLLSGLSSFEECLEEVQQSMNGKAPVDLSRSPREEVRLEELLEVDSQPDYTTNEPTERVTEPLTQQVALLVSLSQEDAGKSSSQNKTVGKGKNKKEEETFLCPSRAVREGIDALRGYSLDQGGPLIQQNKVIKQWCQGHTLDEFQEVITHLTTGQCHDEKHQWWRKNGRMRTYFNAAKLADLTPGCLACGCGTATSPPLESFSCIPEGYNAADEFGEYYGINEKREVEHAAV